MGRRILGLVGCGLMCWNVGAASAQQIINPFNGTPQAPVANGGAPIAMEASAGEKGVLFLGESDPCVRPRLVGQAEYLFWFTRRGHMPPLVTTGDPADAIPGALGQPGTRVLFGDSIDYGPFSGGRFSLALQGDEVSFDVSGFFFGQRSRSFAAASDAGGNPVLTNPIVQQNPSRATFGQESVIIVSDPTIPASGTVQASTSLKLWGIESNGYFTVSQSNRGRLDVLLGFDTLHIETDVDMNTRTDIDTGNGLVTFVTADNFRASNQFYGGQLGGRASYQVYPSVTVDFAAKVALGVVHETVDIRGATAVSGVLSGVFPGGNIALPTSIGSRSSDQFAVVPHLELKVKYDVGSRFSVFGGYDFLYVSNVAEAGNQIDRNNNTSQLVGGTLVGSPVPQPLFRHSDFTAHGVTFGFELRY
jgi:hypothetical protein